LNAFDNNSKVDNKTVYRYLCTKSETEIHLIKFFGREEFYFIKEMSSALIYRGNYFSDEKFFESFFNKFDLRQCISGDIEFYLPKQLIQFLEETKNSKFIECYKKLGDYSKKSLKKHSNDERKFRFNKQEINLTKNVIIDQNCGVSEITIFIHSSSTSSGKGFDRRQNTRNTWVLDAIKYNISLFFVIAEPKDDKTQKELESEALKYKDMIQFGFKDSYFNLTLKDIALIRWAHKKCLVTKYTLKADDDIIINIKELIRSSKNFKKGMTGLLYNKPPPDRKPSSDWFIPECIYSGDSYPVHLSGAAYVITNDVMESWIETLDHYSGPVIDIEDLFTTGFIAELAGIKRHNSKKFIKLYDCLNEKDFCFMFETISAVCVLDDYISRVWNKWKQTTAKSCHLKDI
jgi:hypothetical protein